MRTQIPGAPDFYLAESGQDTPRAPFTVTRVLAAGTWNRALFRGGLGEPQQLAEGGCAGPMQGGAQSHFHRLQIRLASLFMLGEDARQQRGYFARDLVLDRLGRFFSSAVSVSSTGRARQIFSLTSSKSRLNSRNR
jgi:hypothetical protein